MFDFGKHADYMTMAYAATGIFLVGMSVWIYVRYQMLGREQDMIEQLEDEVRDGQMN